MLAAVPSVVGDKAEVVASWMYLLRGCGGRAFASAKCWPSTGPTIAKLCVDLAGRRPTFRVRAEAEKGYKDRTLPMAPEFAEMLQSVAAVTGKAWRSIR